MFTNRMHFGFTIVARCRYTEETIEKKEWLPPVLIYFHGIKSLRSTRRDVSWVKVLLWYYYYIPTPEGYSVGPLAFHFE